MHHARVALLSCLNSQCCSDGYKSLPKLVYLYLSLKISLLVDGADEFGLDLESNRRILAMSCYISYIALHRNNVPCSGHNALY